MGKKSQPKPLPKPPKSGNAGATSVQDLGGLKTIFGVAPIKR